MQELIIEKVALEVHQGLQFMYRSQSDNNGDWHCNLGRLSGGERTLMSLALILAVRLNLCARKNAPGCMPYTRLHAQALTDMIAHSLLPLLVFETGCLHLCRKTLTLGP